MRASSPGSLLLSTALHAVALALIVALSLWFKRATEINPANFDLFDLDQLEMADRFEMPGPPADPQKVRFARPKVKRVPIPKPQPETPATAPRQKDAKVPEKTVPAPSKAKTTSYADFQKQNQKQLQANQKVRSNAKSAPAPGVDAKGIVDDLLKTASGTNGNKATIAALDAYFARLTNALRAAWEQPDSMVDLLVAKVSFHLAADGSISRVKIVKTSGSQEYDQSVLDAFSRVRSIGAVPGGKSGTYVINFKMTE